jgi:hypothetical protein
MNRPTGKRADKPRAKRRSSCLVAAAVLGMALLVPLGARAQGSDGPGAQILFPSGANVFVPTWLNMEMNSDISQSILNLNADVDADILFAVYRRGFGSESRCSPRFR